MRKLYALCLIGAVWPLAGCSDDDGGNPADAAPVDAAPVDAAPDVPYEIWGPDQSNSVAGQALGTNGGYIHIWDGLAVEDAIAAGMPAPAPVTVLNVNELYPNTGASHPDPLPEIGQDGTATGGVLGTIGRLHGVRPSPNNNYVALSLFNPGGGYVGIVDGRTKEPVALFRSTAADTGRSNHMSFWSADGRHVFIANLNAKFLERIDIDYDAAGNIVSAALNLDATLDLAGTGATRVTEEARVYVGPGMLGEVSGAVQAQSDTTPAGNAKEGAAVGRPNTAIVCPISVRNNRHLYITLAGGGLFVVDYTTAPMSIVAEYSNDVVNGAGCGGIEAGDSIFLNAGVSAAEAGAAQSTFTVYRLGNDFPAAPEFLDMANANPPELAFKDSGNTATGGNSDGPASNDSGQAAGTTTRRDSHGMAATSDGRFVHVADRIQNLVEVFDAETLARTTYDLTSANGDGTGGPAPCAGNDPTPDLMEITPNGRYMLFALRGPKPVSVPHSAEGTCPGVGVVEVQDGGARGRMVMVLPTTNDIDADESSDIHGIAIRLKN